MKEVFSTKLIAASHLRRRQITARNFAALYRYILLRLRFRNLQVGVFYLDQGADMQVGPRAKVRFGHGLCILRDFSGYFFGDVEIGNDVFFNRGCYVAIHDKLTVGDNCLFGEMVSIHDQDHVILADRGPLSPLSSRGFVTAPISIGDNVWVGAKASILKGVNIGQNAVVAANAVVTHDVPANTVVGGIPAHVIRRL